MIIEVCCGSLDDAISASAAGADRVELNSALHLGGLTPSISTLKLVKQNINLPVCSMARPRAAGFIYTRNEINVIFEEAKDLLDNGTDGIVFGFLTEDLKVDFELTKKMVELIHSYNKEAIFHRAFDCLNDPYEGMESLINLKVDRVLTSGLKNKAVEGKDLLKDLQEKYGDKIEILAGSGINDTNAKEFTDYTGIRQIHSSCKGWMKDISTHRNDVDYSYAKENEYEVVDEEKVRKLVNLFN